MEGSDETYQLVLELRHGPREDGCYLRDESLAQLTVDLAPAMAWSVFREALEAIAPPLERKD